MSDDDIRRRDLFNRLSQFTGAPMTASVIDQVRQQITASLGTPPYLFGGAAPPQPTVVTPVPVRPNAKIDLYVGSLDEYDATAPVLERLNNVHKEERYALYVEDGLPVPTRHVAHTIVRDDERSTSTFETHFEYRAFAMAVPHQYFDFSIFGGGAGVAEIWFWLFQSASIWPPTATPNFSLGNP